MEVVGMHEQPAKLPLQVAAAPPLSKDPAQLFAPQLWLVGQGTSASDVVLIGGCVELVVSISTGAESEAG